MTCSDRLHGGAAAVVALALAWSAPVFGQAAEDAAYGAADYDKFCAECHGAGGKGDGRLAGHFIRTPTDLTGLAAANDGRFPEVEIYNVIDNGGRIKEHGSAGRPAWGKIFAAEPSPLPAETAADTRILDLIDYIKSLKDE